MKNIIARIIALVGLLATLAAAFAYADIRSANVPYYGELEIPSIGAKVSLYNSTEPCVVSAENAAAMFWGDIPGGEAAICDSRSQSFKNLDQVSIGTVATVTTETDIYLLRCVDVMTARLTQEDILDSTGESLHGRGILMYTSIPDSGDVLVSIWK